MSVLNGLGHGFPEKLYENALALELKAKNIPFLQQPRYEVAYLNEKVGEFIPDLVVFDKVIVDLKTIDRITDRERGQILNYLKVTNLKVGLLLNMIRPKLEWDRVVL
jgi:GxxExxY protein